ncbi:Glucan endo-1,3-beta-glucosidase [Fusarium agapanthi]|uniref:Glucan endo-1,3-beta-glucosidase n=1 Tax=Fusarium agapanthi TaxID=1803897 RepID=A0A9P5BD80_9HYPO|nr:Glucan endo-1,3-beta-glucosidase [Fusarium agapanthi]
MRFIFVFVFLLKPSLVTLSSTVPSPYRTLFTPEGFIKVDPGGVEGVKVTTDNLLSETISTTTRPSLTGRGSDASPLPIELVNNFNKGSVKAYITGLDAGGKVFFALQNGKLIYPDARGSRLPVKVTNDVAIFLPLKGQSLSITLPSFVRSGRIYFSNGDLQFFVVNIGDGNSLVQPSVTNLRDPNANLSWGFVEFTYIRNILYANISYVDFVGLVLGMMLVAKDGSTQTTAGLETDAVIKICDDLIKQRKIDNHKWTSLCIADTAGKPIRVLSPGNLHDVDPEIFGTYWETYLDHVWEKYITQDLIIDTKSKAGMIKCRVVDHKLKCDGHERGLSKPEDQDIWGCNSGPFAISENDSTIHTAIVPPLCASIVRSTLLLDDGFMQPRLGQTSYYTTNPTNHYSRIVHSYEVDGRGYAFPYDDVNPDDSEDASGVVSSDDVDLLTIHVGSPLSNYSSQ